MTNISLSRRMKSLKKSTYILILVLVVLGFWLSSYIYGEWKEKNLMEKYRAMPEWASVVEMMDVNLRDLAANPPKAKRVAATMDMGLEWYNLREFDLAAKWWKRGLDIEPNNVIGWVNLGYAYRDLGKFAKAEKAFKRSMKIARVGETEACLALGEMYKYAYTAKKDLEDDVYLECLQKHKDDRNLIARLAGYYRDIGDRQNATLYFDKLFSIDPTPEVSEELRNLRLNEPSNDIDGEEAN